MASQKSLRLLSKSLPSSRSSVEAGDRQRLFRLSRRSVDVAARRSGSSGKRRQVRDRNAGVAVGRWSTTGRSRLWCRSSKDQPIGLQPVKRPLVKLSPLRLTIASHEPSSRANRGPRNALDDSGRQRRGRDLRSLAEFAAARPGVGMTEHRRKGVAEVQPSRGRGGETCDLQDSLHDKGDRGDS